MIGSRFNARMKAFYQSLLARGDARKRALVAVMRTVFVTLNTMIQNHEKWREPALADDNP